MIISIRKSKGSHSAEIIQLDGFTCLSEEVGARFRYVRPIIYGYPETYLHEHRNTFDLEVNPKDQDKWLTIQQLVNRLDYMRDTPKHLWREQLVKGLGLKSTKLYEVNLAGAILHGAQLWLGNGGEHCIDTREAQRFEYSYDGYSNVNTRFLFVDMFASPDATGSRLCKIITMTAHKFNIHTDRAKEFDRYEPLTKGESISDALSRVEKLTKLQLKWIH